MKLSKILFSCVLAISASLPVSLNAAPKDEPVAVEEIPSLITGKWETSKKESQAGMTVEGKTTYEFMSENNVSLRSEMKLIFPINESGYHNVLTFSINFTAAGNYTLDADKLTINLDQESIAVEYLPATAEIDDAISQQMLPMIAQAIPEMEKELRASLAQPENFTVASISKNKMEFINDDNQTVKFKRK